MPLIINKYNWHIYEHQIFNFFLDKYNPKFREIFGVFVNISTLLHENLPVFG